MWFDPTHVEAVRETFPEWTAFLFAFLSYLGSVWFVAPAVVLAFWFCDRHRFASWLGIVIGSYAVMVGLKGAFDVGRPGVGPAIAPETLPTSVTFFYAPLVEVSSSSFPSGHAIAATTVWTMLALETNVGTQRRRLAAAAVLVSLVSFSRVAVGLHFPLDVVVGVAVAIVYLSVVLTVREATAERGVYLSTSIVFVVVAVIALCALLVGGRVDAAALAGGAVGALAVWRYAPPPREPWSPTPRRLGQATLGVCLLALVALVLVITENAFVWFVVGIVGGAVVVGAPRLSSGRSELVRAKRSPLGEKWEKDRR